MSSAFVSVICNTSPWWRLNNGGRLRQGSHKVNWCGTGPAGSPLWYKTTANRLIYLGNTEHKKSARIELLDSFTPGTEMAPQSAELMFLPFCDTRITSHTLTEEQLLRRTRFTADIPLDLQEDSERKLLNLIVIWMSYSEQAAEFN